MEPGQGAALGGGGPLRGVERPVTGGGGVRGPGRGQGEVVTGGGERGRERGEAGELCQRRTGGEGEAGGDRGEE